MLIILALVLALKVYSCPGPHQPGSSKSQPEGVDLSPGSPGQSEFLYSLLFFRSLVISFEAGCRYEGMTTSR